MAIDLTEYEAAPKHDGDYGDRLAAAQERLRRVQIAHIVHRRRAMVVVEGWATAGKGDAIARATAGWDPRHLTIFPIAAPTEQERARHHLARFWEKVPAAGDIHVFDCSWYGRVLGERAAGAIDKPGWRRAYDEINEFEAQQKDSGTTLVKLFLHISAEEQDARLRARLADPWQRWRLTPEDLAERTRRDAMLTAAHEMFAHTDTRWAPWKAIDAGRAKYTRLAVLEHVATTLEKGLPLAEPAADPAVLEAAREAGLVDA